MLQYCYCDGGNRREVVVFNAARRKQRRCGPYAAALLERMGLTVAKIDADDLSQGPGGGPFDLIVTEGAVGRAPKAWLAAMAMHGRLGVVERDGPVGKAAVYVRAADGVGRREMFDSTPPVMPGLEVRHGFAFD